MTDLPDAGEIAGPDAVAPVDPAPPGPLEIDSPPEFDGAPEPIGPSRPSLFSLEGRATPGLYLVGWIATLMGGGVLFVSVSSSNAGASPWLFLAGLLLLALGLFAATGSQAVDRARRTDLAYRGPSPVLVLITVVVVSWLAAIVLAPLSALGLDTGSPVGVMVATAIIAAVYAGVVRMFVVGTGALSWGEMGLGGPTSPAVRELVLGLVLGVPIVALTLVLDGVFGRVLPVPASPMPVAADALGLVANAVTLMILAPLGQELFFRGFATTAWALSSGTRAAIVRGALLFAIARAATVSGAAFGDAAQLALVSFIGILPLGVALGWVFLGRRSLYAAIGLHAAFGLAQLVVAATLGRGL